MSNEDNAEGIEVVDAAPMAPPEITIGRHTVTLEEPSPLFSYALGLTTRRRADQGFGAERDRKAARPWCGGSADVVAGLCDVSRKAQAEGLAPRA